jgi:predicted transposase YbfD/YdcC
MIHLLLDGSPAHQRVFSRINPEQFQKSFLSWVKGISKITAGEIIALDGKQSRNSGDNTNGQGVLNTVSAWAVTNRIVLGQKMVEGKSNEITALPELIKILDLAGCIVTRRFGGKLPPKSSLTIDAMGCQREIVKKIIEKDADYVIAVKKNQPSLYEQIEGLFKRAIATGGEGLNLSDFKTKEINGGRKDNAPANFTVLRHIAVNLINQNKSRKLSVKSKRFLAALDDKYLTEILEGIL